MEDYKILWKFWGKLILGHLRHCFPHLIAVLFFNDVLLGNFYICHDMLISKFLFMSELVLTRIQCHDFHSGVCFWEVLQCGLWLWLYIPAPLNDLSLYQLWTMLKGIVCSIHELLVLYHICQSFLILESLVLYSKLLVFYSEQYVFYL